MNSALTTWGPLVVALVVPGIGTLHQMGVQDAMAKATETRVGELEKRVNVAADAATTATLRVDQLEQRAHVTDDVLRDIQSQLRSMNNNIIALCSATHGAQCVR
jgi:hypothetical protein